MRVTTGIFERFITRYVGTYILCQVLRVFFLAGWVRIRDRITSRSSWETEMAKIQNKTVEVVEQPGKSRSRLVSDVAVSPYYSNASTLIDYGGQLLGDMSLTDTCKALQEQVAAVHKGDLKEAEALLMVQAVTLNSMFNELARRAAINMGENMEATDKYMKLALKAQGQCRATLETLANIKNPPVVFAKQANIAHNQQVNQTVAGGSFETNTRTHAHAHAGNFEAEHNRLSEGGHELLENTRASSIESGVNPALEAVGTGYRTSNGRR